MNVYLVTFLTGDYEDRRERDIGAFTSREEADAFTAAVNADLKALGMHTDHPLDSWTSRDYGDLSVDSTGAEVYVSEVPLSPVFVSKSPVLVSVAK